MKLGTSLMLVVLCAQMKSVSVAYSAEKPQIDFPGTSILWIVPFPPGGSNEVLGRHIAIKVGERLGQQVVIENRAGANGIIGRRTHSPAEGYSLLMACDVAKQADIRVQ